MTLYISIMMSIGDFQSHILLLKECNLPVIVEGVKDRKALEFFGINNFVILNKPLFEIVELVAGQTKECVILTDLDVEGKKLYSMLSEDLQHRGVRINNNFRNFLFKETELRQIEGLKNYVKKVFGPAHF